MEIQMQEKIPVASTDVEANRHCAFFHSLELQRLFSFAEWATQLPLSTCVTKQRQDPLLSHCEQGKRASS